LNFFNLNAQRIDEAKGSGIFSRYRLDSLIRWGEDQHALEINTKLIVLE